jgi:hypothetical protein
MSVLDEKLKAYLEDPNGTLDLSGLTPSTVYGRDERTEGAEQAASFLLKW